MFQDTAKTSNYFVQEANCKGKAWEGGGEGGGKETLSLTGKACEQGERRVGKNFPHWQSLRERREETPSLIGRRL